MEKVSVPVIYAGLKQRKREMKTCAGCPNPAACAKAGKCLMAGKPAMAKGGAVKGKKPGAALAIMIAMPVKGKGKTKMAMGGCATKKK
jgi:hypothetical protein